MRMTGSSLFAKLPFCLHLLGALLCGKLTLLKFYDSFLFFFFFFFFQASKFSGFVLTSEQTNKTSRNEEVHNMQTEYTVMVLSFFTDRSGKTILRCRL